MLPCRDRVDLRAMAMKGYSVFPKAPASLEPHHQIVLCHIQDTRWGGGLTPLQRSSRCILQLQLTGQNRFIDFLPKSPLFLFLTSGGHSNIYMYIYICIYIYIYTRGLKSYRTGCVVLAIDERAISGLCYY